MSFFEEYPKASGAVLAAAGATAGLMVAPMIKTNCQTMKDGTQACVRPYNAIVGAAAGATTMLVGGLAVAAVSPRYRSVGLWTAGFGAVADLAIWWVGVHSYAK